MSAEASSSTSNAHAAVLTLSEAVPADAVRIQGPDLSKSIDLSSLLESYKSIGFQATGLAKAIEIVEAMVSFFVLDAGYKLILLSQRRQRYDHEEPLTLFLGYTSNLISSGLREVIRFLAQYKLVDCIVTTAGGIEEDFVKCLGPTVLGEFELDGADLRRRG